jgi:hypothetical protein
MRAVYLLGSLILVSMLNALAHAQPNQSISVSFSIDGARAQCNGFQVELRFNGDSIKPKQSGQSFEIPDVFDRPAKSWKDDQGVDIGLTCNGQTLVFPHQHPAFVQSGGWELGIAHPLYAVREYGYTHAFDRGAWLGYLIFEGEPGVVTFSPQGNPPTELADDLRNEQLKALPQRARDIAYVLAVFNVEYQTNRDYLLSSLKSCLSKPKESSENEVCDSDLLSFVANLYWRGDSELLAALLQVAESRRDVIGDIGTFYADLLDRRGAIALNAMRELSDAKQQLVCKLADADDLNIDSPKRQRIIAFLHGAKTEAASQCLRGLGNS